MVAGVDSIGDAFVDIGARTAAFDAKMRQVQGQLTTIGNKMTAFGKRATMLVSVPLAGLAAASVKAFASFDDAMTRSTAIMGQLSPEIRKQLEETARVMSKESVFSAKDLAESYFFLASAGLSAEQSIAALPVVTKFATAGMFNLSQATDLLTDAQSALGLTVEDTEQNMKNMVRISDVLVKANTLANASVSQFSTALTSKAAAAMKAFNIDMEEGVAVLAAFADQGVKAELAGNTFDRILRLMTASARNNSEAFQKLGIEVFDTEGNLRNMADIIEQMENALGDMSAEAKGAALETLGFKARIQGAILPILGTSNAIREYEKALRDAAGTTQEISDKQLESFLSKMKMIKNRVIDAGITIGEKLIPVVEKLAEKIAALADKISAMSAEDVENWVKFGLALIALGPAIAIIGLLTKAVKGLTVAMAFLAANPVVATITAVIAALVALGWVSKKLANKIKKDRKEESDAVRKQFDDDFKAAQASLAKQRKLEESNAEDRVNVNKSATDKIEKQESDLTQTIIEHVNKRKRIYSQSFESAAGLIRAMQEKNARSFREEFDVQGGGDMLVKLGEQELDETKKTNDALDNLLKKTDTLIALQGGEEAEPVFA